MKNKYIIPGIGVAVMVLALTVLMTSNPISKYLLLCGQRHGILSNQDMTVPQVEPQAPLPVDTPVEQAAPGQATLENSLKAVLKGTRGNYSIGYKSLTGPQEVILNPGQMPSASVIKLFIMAAAFNQAALEQLNLDDKLVIGDLDKVGGTGSLSGRPSGTSLTIRHLIELMITESDNTAANLLIDKLGFDCINNTIQELGCKDTVLQRKMMDKSSGKENYTSVQDLILLLQSIYKGTCVSSTADQEMISILKKQKQRNLIPRGLPSGCVSANKAGNLPGIVNDAAIVCTAQGDYILCILSNKVDEKQANEIIPKLSKTVYADHIKQ